MSIVHPTDPSDARENYATDSAEIDRLLDRDPETLEYESLAEKTPSVEEERLKPTENLSMFRMTLLNAFVLVYGALISAMGVIVLPREMERMFEKRHAIYLGIVVGVAGFSQLICPAAGYFSDRCTHRWGRRRPIFGVSVFLACVLLLGLWYARTAKLGHLYLLLFFTAMLCLNTAYACFTGLISDIVPSAQMGVASGMMGVLTMLGAGISVAGLGFWVDIGSAYPIYAGSMLVTSLMTILSVSEVAIDHERPWVASEILASYNISYESHGDFYWVFVGRALYYMAVSVQTFLFFYLRDVIHVDNAKTATATLCMLAQLSAGVISLPMGKLSDNHGRKGFIYTACGVMSLVYFAYSFTRTFEWVCIWGFIYGIGNGMYIAVDYALAVQTLPSKTDTAKDLGLWGIAAFIGMMLGPLLCGPLLYVFGHTATHAHYSLRGYSVLMMVGSFVSLMSGVVVTKIKSCN